MPFGPLAQARRVRVPPAAMGAAESVAAVERCCRVHAAPVAAPVAALQFSDLQERYVSAE